MIDPVNNPGIAVLPDQALGAFGMYRSAGEGITYVLIFQHISSALHLARQLQHIEGQYQAELSQIRVELETLEARTLSLIDTISLADVKPVGVRCRQRQGRIQVIRTILPPGL